MDHLWCNCPWARVLFEKVSVVFSVHLSFDFGFYHWLLQAMARNFSPQNSVFELSVLSTFGIIGRPSKAPSSICIRWQLPPIQFIKVNVDGGAAGAPGQLTGGGVFRDNYGVFRGCFAMQHGSVEIAYDKHWLHLWLETDSVYVVNIFERHTSLVPWRLLGQWHRVLRLMGDMQIVVSHIFREGNASADRLTRESVDSFEWWSTIPDFLTTFLNRDRSVEFYRFSNNRGVPFSLCVGFVPNMCFPTQGF
ncbi:hypothetical protein ACS0TY_012701 [Phlomoides rotata]